MTYAELVAEVPEWMYAQNRDLVAAMPEIVRDAHLQLFEIINHNFFRTRLTGITIPVTGELDLSAEDPAVMEIRAIRLRYRTDTEWVPIFRRDLEMLSTLYARNIPARPRYYAEADGPLILQMFPTPSAAIEAEITCNQRCPILSPTTATNLLSTRADRALKAATIRQAALYMQDAEMIQTWDAEMTAAVNEINAAYGRRERDDTGERPRDTTNASGS